MRGVVAAGEGGQTREYELFQAAVVMLVKKGKT
jgi:hypothetical protein